MSLRAGTTRRVAAAALSAMGVVTLLGYLAGLAPMLEGLAARRAAAQAIVEAEQEHRAFTTDAQNRRRSLRDVEEQLAGAVVLEPASQVNARMQAIVERFADAGLAIESQQQDQPDYRAGRHGTVAIRLRAAGTYPQCVALLRRLHTDFHDLAVESLDLSAAGTDNSRRLTMAVGFVWFVAPPERPAGDNSK